MIWQLTSNKVSKCSLVIKPESLLEMIKQYTGVEVPYDAKIDLEYSHGGIIGVVADSIATRTIVIDWEVPVERSDQAES